MTKDEIKALESVFKVYPEIKLVYFFGSKAEGREGPLSDYDFGVYLDEKDAKRNFDVKLALMDEIGRLFKTDHVDVVMLNMASMPELKYNIISTGNLIYEKERYSAVVEPDILNEYFDFRHMLLKYGLTKA